MSSTPYITKYAATVVVDNVGAVVFGGSYAPKQMILTNISGSWINGWYFFSTNFYFAGP